MAADSEAVIDVYRKLNPRATPSDLFFLIASDYRYGAPIMKIAERRAALAKATRPLVLLHLGDAGGRRTAEIAAYHRDSRLRSTTSRSPANSPAAAPMPWLWPTRSRDAWIAFARTGDPNTPKLPHWPAFNANERPTMVINNQSKVVSDPIREQRLAMFHALNLA